MLVKCLDYSCACNSIAGASSCTRMSAAEQRAPVEGRTRGDMDSCACSIHGHRVGGGLRAECKARMLGLAL